MGFKARKKKSKSVARKLEDPYFVMLESIQKLPKFWYGVEERCIDILLKKFDIVADVFDPYRTITGQIKYLIKEDLSQDPFYAPTFSLFNEIY